MGLEQWYATHLIKGLTKGEKLSMVRTITDEFITSMSPQDRKDMLRIVLPDIVDRLMSGMTSGDRKELVDAIMPMIAQMGSAHGANHDKKEIKNRLEDKESRQIK